VPVVSVRQEGPASLQTMGVSLVAGRFFTERDGVAAERVALVNQTLARRFFPDESPIGTVISLEPPEQLAPPDFREIAGGPFVRWTIVGLVGDVRYRQPADPVESVVYVPYLQRTRQALMGWSPEFVVARADSDPSALVPAIRAAIHSTAPQQPLAEIHTIDQIVDESLGNARLSTSLLGIFSAVALFLAALGIYGVVSSSVAYRTHELGVRMALGARSGSVVWLVLRQTLLLALASVTAGVIAAAAFTRLFSSQLYGITPGDAPTFVAAPALLTVVVLCAAWLPARRAARIDPLLALRAE